MSGHAPGVTNPRRCAAANRSGRKKSALTVNCPRSLARSRPTRLIARSGAGNPTIRDVLIHVGIGVALVLAVAGPGWLIERWLG